MLYELRLYRVAPGALDALHARFRDHLPALFKAHGIECVGRWSVTSGPYTPGFVYMMAYRDLAEREARWASFYADPEWARVRAATSTEIELVERFDLAFLRTGAFWQPQAQQAGQTLGGVHELALQQVTIGQPAAVSQYLSELYLPALREAGAQVMAACDMVSGFDMPQVVLLYAWPDAAARQAGWEAMARNPALHEAVLAQNRRLGRSLLGRADVYLLQPASYSLPAASPGAALL